MHTITLGYATNGAMRRIPRPPSPPVVLDNPMIPHRCDVCALRKQQLAMYHAMQSIHQPGKFSPALQQRLGEIGQQWLEALA